MTADEVVTEHVRFVTEESSRIRTGSIPARLGVPYGDSDRERVDIFGTDLPDDSPIFVYISGGYWQMMSGEISAYVVEPMYEANIVTVVVDYARAPAGKGSGVFHSKSLIGGGPGVGPGVGPGGGLEI
jgi:arylformamidase